MKYLRQSGVLPQLQRALSSIPFSYSNEDSTSPDYEGLCQGRVKGGVLCNTTLQEQLMREDKSPLTGRVKYAKGVRR